MRKLLLHAKPHAFFSFADADRGRVKALQLLEPSSHYELEFWDGALRPPFESEEARDVAGRVTAKRLIREKIDRTSVTVCLIGERTHQDGWVAWELAESVRHGNVLIAMALDGIKEATLPRLVAEQGVKFHRWNRQGLAHLIPRAGGRERRRRPQFLTAPAVRPAT